MRRGSGHIPGAQVCGGELRSHSCHTRHDQITTVTWGPLHMGVRERGLVGGGGRRTGALGPDALVNGAGLNPHRAALLQAGILCSF